MCICLSTLTVGIQGTQINCLFHRLSQIIGIVWDNQKVRVGIKGDIEN